MLGSIFKVAWLLLKGLMVYLTADLLTLLTTFLIASTIPQPILNLIQVIIFATLLIGLGLLVFSKSLRAYARWPLLTGLTLAALSTLLSLIPYQPLLLVLFLPLILLPAYRLYHKYRPSTHTPPTPPSPRAPPSLYTYFPNDTISPSQKLEPPRSPTTHQPAIKPTNHKKPQ